MTNASRLRRANLLAWLAIAVATALFIVESRGGIRAPSSEKLAAHASVSAQQAIMGSLVNGMNSPPFQTAFAQQLSTMRTQVEDLVSVDQPGSELATAALLARLGDRDRALELLAELQNRIDAGDVTADDKFRKTLNAVTELVDATEHPGARAISEEACADVIKAMGPTGRTLVAQANGDQEELDRLGAAGAVLLVVLVLALLMGCVLALGGIAAIVVFLVMAALGKTAGIGAMDELWSHVYAEMFAVWMFAYLGLAHAPRVVFEIWEGYGNEGPGVDVRLALSVAATIAAAALALWWGTRRGLSLRGIMTAVGFRRFVAMDIVWGVVCWSMGIALLIVGVMLAVVLSKIFGDGHMRASHPIQQMVEESGAAGLFLTYILACVCAPIGEELFFRGALYRNLRQSFGRWGAVGSVVIAIAVSSVLFAAIHPQGLIFIPVLASLAVAFCIMREWRGTINASIVAHAINNAVVLTLNVLMLRG
ncbi:MAG: CPBP family intramembrane metalloprotease [Planctomycetota bacterium]|nr:MAG: CPBP family intramembrane metalloprotease [Planctomycetota bacterium]